MSDEWNKALEAAALCAEVEAHRIGADVHSTAEKDTSANAMLDGGALSRLRMSLAARAGTAAEIAASIRAMKMSDNQQ